MGAGLRTHRSCNRRMSVWIVPNGFLPSQERREGRGCREYSRYRCEWVGRMDPCLHKDDDFCR